MIMKDDYSGEKWGLDSSGKKEGREWVVFAERKRGIEEKREVTGTVRDFCRQRTQRDRG